MHLENSKDGETVEFNNTKQGIPVYLFLGAGYIYYMFFPQLNISGTYVALYRSGFAVNGETSKFAPSGFGHFESLCLEPRLAFNKKVSPVL